MDSDAELWQAPLRRPAALPPPLQPPPATDFDTPQPSPRSMPPSAAPSPARGVAVAAAAAAAAAAGAAQLPASPLVTADVGDVVAAAADLVLACRRQADTKQRRDAARNSLQKVTLDVLRPYDLPLMTRHEAGALAIRGLCSMLDAQRDQVLVGGRPLTPLCCTVCRAGDQRLAGGAAAAAASRRGGGSTTAARDDRVGRGRQASRHREGRRPCTPHCSRAGASPAGGATGHAGDISNLACSPLSYYQHLGTVTDTCPACNPRANW